MPELPEVQTIVDDLNKKVLGRKIVAAWYDWPKFRAVVKTVGQTIQKAERRGKNILLHLNGQKILLIHQKMTGHLLVGQWEIKGKKIIPLAPPALKEKINDYLHFILTLDDGRMIGLSDLRKFGKVVFGEAAAVENLPELKKLGPDALAVKFEEFTRRIKSRHKTIYQVLMDQTTLSGIGNIYASDILWEAGTYPFQSAAKLTNEELKRLWRASKKILKLALKLRGTSTADYRDTAGEKGQYGERRLAYKREGEPCRRCGALMKRSKKGGRSVHFCPNCQSP